MKIYLAGNPGGGSKTREIIMILLGCKNRLISYFHRREYGNIAIKIILTSVIVVVVSEIAKQSSFIGSILASVPLVSVLAIMWLYIDTKDIQKVSSLATSIFWLVLPSLALFIILPILLKNEINFYISILISISGTICCYWFMVTVLNHFGIKL